MSRANTSATIDPQTAPLIVLQSCESRPTQFRINRRAARLSKVLSGLADDAPPEEEVVIPLPNVSDRVLALVVQYLTHHAERPPLPLPKPLSSDVSEHVSDWDKNYIRKLVDDFGDTGVEKYKNTIEVMLVADHLGIESLVDLACAVLASVMKDKEPQEIRDEFDVEEDFSADEEAKLRDAALL
jgi:S-phase kinase-associated protein 1